MISNEIEFIYDPGHGWLKVPLKDLVELEIVDKITEYSFMNDNYAFLEEDCDAGTYLNAVREKGYPDRQITELYTVKFERPGAYRANIIKHRVAVQDCLKRACNSNTRVRVYYGSKEAGKTWVEEMGVEGYVDVWERGEYDAHYGLAYYSASRFTVSILVDHVLRVVSSKKPYNILFTVDNFDNGVWELHSLQDEGDPHHLIHLGYTHSVSRDGITEANFKSLRGAAQYMAKMTKGAQ